MYKNILITGGTSKISIHLKKMIPKSYNIFAPKRNEWDLSNLNFDREKIELIKKCDKIFLCHSTLSNKKHLLKKDSEIHNQLNINLLSKVKICEISLKYNPKVRIVIIGSESGIKGSYDIVYALSKASINKYVEERKIFKKGQQLICIAPSTIVDGKMTLMRKDRNNVRKSINNNPKKRGIYAKEISKLIYDLSFRNTDYITNTVININGGKFSRM